jgi:zinc protease
MSSGLSANAGMDVLPERVVIDGVPVFSLPLSGPLRATLMFRVGFADETLPRLGITHLVEYLALFCLMAASDSSRVNGWVEPTRTRFTVSGTPSEVKAFHPDQGMESAR